MGETECMFEIRFKEPMKGEGELPAHCTQTETGNKFIRGLSRK